MIEWISVKERLPSPDQKVIFWYAGSIYTGKLANETDNEWRTEELGALPYRNVTHWAEFPEPPPAHE